MAIKFYTGVPRSGKTYKAVSFIYYMFVLKKNHNQIYVSC